MADTYVQKINGKFLAAAEVVPDSPLAQKLEQIEGIGAFETATLTTGSNPVPNVTKPSTKVIYLTKVDDAPTPDKYMEWIYTGTDGESAVASKWACIGETSLDLSGYKTKQNTYTAQNLGVLKTITSLTQNANGEISATASDIQSATTGQKGVVQLTGSIGAAVSSENNKAASEKAVRDAINALDYTASNLGQGKTITSLKETDGVISATAQDIKIAESQVTNLTTDLDSKVSDVAYDSNSKEITQTKGSTTTTVISITDLQNAMDLSGKEDKSNKVTSVRASSSATDTNYPSEKAVRTELDKKQATITFDGIYNSSTNKAATVATVTNKIAALDAAVTSTDGTNVQVKVTETDGKISAVNITTDNTENKSNKVTSWSSTTTDAHYPSEKLVKTALDSKLEGAKIQDASSNLTVSNKIVIIPKATQGTPASGSSAATAGVYGVVQLECITI